MILYAGFLVSHHSAYPCAFCLLNYNKDVQTGCIRTFSKRLQKKSVGLAEQLSNCIISNCRKLTWCIWSDVLNFLACHVLVENVYGTKRFHSKWIGKSLNVKYQGSECSRRNGCFVSWSWKLVAPNQPYSDADEFPSPWRSHSFTYQPWIPFRSSLLETDLVSENWISKMHDRDLS